MSTTGGDRGWKGDVPDDRAFRLHQDPVARLEMPPRPAAEAVRDSMSAMRAELNHHG